MTQKRFLTIILSFILSINALSQSLSDVFVIDKEHLTLVKQKIKEGDKLLTKANMLLIKSAEKSLRISPYSVVNKEKESPSGDNHDYVSLAPYWWPNPDTKDSLPYIRKDGKRNPEISKFKDHKYLSDMATNVQVLSLAYFISDDEKYAIHAANLLKVFFLDGKTRMNPNMNYAQAIKGTNEGRGAGLIDSRHFIRVIESVNLLKGSENWQDTDEVKLKKWFSDFLNWMQTSPNGIDEMDTPNNHGTWYDAQRLSFALFIGEMEQAKGIVNNAIKRLDNQMDKDGSFPKELARTTSLNYSCFNLHAFFIVAEMAERTGTDFWKLETPSMKSLQKGFDYIYPYLSKEKEWKGQQIKAFDYNSAAPLLLKASAKLNCNSCYKTFDKLGLKVDNRLLLLLVSEYK